MDYDIVQVCRCGGGKIRYSLVGTYFAVSIYTTVLYHQVVDPLDDSTVPPVVVRVFFMRYIGRDTKIETIYCT